MTVTVFLDGARPPDDYEVRYAGQTVGRIYRMDSTGREMWHWTQIGGAPSHGPNGGVADLDEAKAASGERGSGAFDRRGRRPKRFIEVSALGERHDMLGLSLSAQIVMMRRRVQPRTTFEGDAPDPAERRMS
jgi:hypothetical protein